MLTVRETQDGVALEHLADLGDVQDASGCPEALEKLQHQVSSKSTHGDAGIFQGRRRSKVPLSYDIRNFSETATFTSMSNLHMEPLPSKENMTDEKYQL